MPVSPATPFGVNVRRWNIDVDRNLPIHGQAVGYLLYSENGSKMVKFYLRAPVGLNMWCENFPGRLQWPHRCSLPEMRPSMKGFDPFV